MAYKYGTQNNVPTPDTGVMDFFKSLEQPTPLHEFRPSIYPKPQSVNAGGQFEMFTPTPQNYDPRVNSGMFMGASAPQRTTQELRQLAAPAIQPLDPISPIQTGSGVDIGLNLNTPRVIPTIEMPSLPSQNYDPRVNSGMFIEGNTPQLNAGDVQTSMWDSVSDFGSNALEGMSNKISGMSGKDMFDVGLGAFAAYQGSRDAKTAKNQMNKRIGIAQDELAIRRENQDAVNKRRGL